MLNTDLLLSLLKEMSEGHLGKGRTEALETFGMSEEKQDRLHHANLLVDSGLAQRISDGIIEITLPGYNFLNAVEKQPTLRDRFKELINKGIPLVEAISKIVELASQIA